MNPIKLARRISRQAHLRAAGVLVQIERGSEKSEFITATVGYSKSFENVDNVVLSYRTKDYLINVADYIIDGTLTTPQVGDYIVETLDGDKTYFEVDHDTSMDQYEYTDAERRVYRIHTKEAYK